MNKINKFKTILIGGEPARRAAGKIGEFDYLCELPFSVVGFVNPNTTERFTLVNSGKVWHDVPIYQSLGEISQEFDAVGIYLNAKHVLKWVQEVAKDKRAKNVVIFAEDVPEKDQREIVALAKKHKIDIIGPSSTGIIVPGSGRLGEIGGDWNNLQKCQLDKSGPIGLITKSGTISGELLWVVSQSSAGVHTAVQIGGDAFPGTDFVWWLEEFAKNPAIKTVVMAGEAGGDLEERAAKWYQNYVHRSQFTVNREHVPTMNRPFKLLAVISGRFLEAMPKGQKFGHAGAKQEESGIGRAQNKIEALRKAGAEVVEFDRLGSRLKELTF